MLKVYTLEQFEEWDSIVRSFKNYDVYWLSGYVKAFYLHGDGMPLLFYYNKGSTRGINVVMKRDIANDERFDGKIEKGNYYDFSTPYGYGGWIVEGRNAEVLFNEYENWCTKNRIVSEFVRFHPMIKNHESTGEFYQIIKLGKVVHIDLESREKIWANLISQNRNKIRKSEKNGVVIYNGRFPQIYKEFKTIYDSTMNRDNADKYYYFSEKFFESILNDLPENSQIFYAVKNDVIIAVSIILMANGMMNYHLSGSLQKYGQLAPVNLLLYKAALWGTENGYKSLYLGGGVGSEDDSLFAFKRGFNRGLINNFFIGKRIYSKERYEELRTLRKENIKNMNYFPEYRG